MNKLHALLEREERLQQKITEENCPQRKLNLLDEQYLVLLEMEKILDRLKPIDLIQSL